MMRYQEQLKELRDIYLRSQNAKNDDFFDSLLKELRQLSNNWHNLEKNHELSFPEYTQLIEKKYHLSESIQLRKWNVKADFTLFPFALNYGAAVSPP